MAPLTPFITERVWQDLVRADRRPSCPESVHLAALAAGRRPPGRRRARRADGAGPPARRAGPGGPGRGEGQDPAAAAPRRWSRRHAYDAADRRAAGRGRRGAQRRRARVVRDAAGDLVDYSAKGNFRDLGKRFGKETPQVAAAIAAADAAALAAALAPTAGHGRRRRPRGRASARRGDRLRASARGLVGGQRAGRDGRARPRADAELRRAGLAREIVRTVQEARKSSGLESPTGSRLRWTVGAEVAAAMREHGDDDRRRGARGQRRSRTTRPTTTATTTSACASPRQGLIDDDWAATSRSRLSEAACVGLRCEPRVLVAEQRPERRGEASAGAWLPTCELLFSLAASWSSWLWK